ncbi:hypothetical protein P5V34_04740 [Mycobacteroides abscessus subsp. abscessus]|uniref:hypothetical protein n=1 Tax=Mycobacteroides abscessus TaxID=36809 RepID=UPI00266D42FC|nr:hypothetical protein [Mycobacteroides abscessus]MDO3013294.1 hypothetical protein [Mycobacteroides abscessus subsp. abscessus]
MEAAVDAERYSFFRPNISRPPTPRERAALIARRNRLQASSTSVDAATEHLRVLADRQPLDNLRVREQFIRLLAPAADVDTSDRSASSRRHRPPCTRLMSGRGSAIPFLLTALLEAQSRTAPGHKCHSNTTPLRGHTGAATGWTEYIATDAQASANGRTLTTVRDKKIRQIVSSLNRLHSENLVFLPHRDDPQGKYENFLILREDGSPTADNDAYSVPEHDYFPVPITLFTRGWIHVLEDSELTLLLITARLRHKRGPQLQPLDATARKLHYGLSRDAFEAGHRMLDYLEIADVVSDICRSPRLSGVKFSLFDVYAC